MKFSQGEQAKRQSGLEDLTDAGFASPRKFYEQTASDTLLASLLRQELKQFYVF